MGATRADKRKCNFKKKWMVCQDPKGNKWQTQI